MHVIDRHSNRHKLTTLTRRCNYCNVFGQAPGSFYYDRMAATIAYIPREPSETAAVLDRTAFTSKEETLLEVNTTENLRWEGVTFQHATWHQVRKRIF